MFALLLLLPLVAHADGFDHSEWDALLRQFLNSRSQVNYAGWKESGTTTLDHYLEQFKDQWPGQLSGAETKAALINLYNAHTIRWILAHYPVESIWKTPKPFRTARHRVDNRNVSLDDIETRLRATGDGRIHAALVCAARSCPPLRREAYVASRLDAQLSDNTRAWLTDTRLNSFQPDSRTAIVSPIFKWYRKDFVSLEKFLREYGPQDKVGFLAAGGAKIRFQDYSWGLNDTSDIGSRYSGPSFWFDYLRNK